MTNPIDEIKSHFEDPNRVTHDVDSYRKSQSGTETIDPYEPLREDLIVDTVIKHTPTSVLDIGCGIGHLVLRLLENKINAYGIDVSSTMIETAKGILVENEHDSNRVVCDDYLTYPTTQKFDALIANGVIWYYEDKEDFLKKIKSMAQRYARVWVVHRNLLFNLFALNQGSLDVFSNDFLSHLEPESKISVTNEILNVIPAFETKIRNNGGLNKPYDNPLTIHELYNECGFKIEDIIYTYIHPCPPRFMDHCDDKNYTKAQHLYARHWAGAFLGSQFIVQATLIH